MSSVLFVCLCFALCALAQHVFDASDQKKLVAYINAVAGTENNFGGIRDARFAVSALSDLGEPIQHKDTLCSLASRQLSDETADSLADVFHAALLATRLSCQTKVSKACVALLKNALESQKISEIYTGIVGLSSLKRASLISETTSFDAAVKRILALGTSNGKFKSSPASKEATAFNAGLAMEAIALVGDADARTAVVKELSSLLGALEDAGDGALAFRDADEESFTSLANVRATSAVAYGLAELDRLNVKLTTFSDSRISKVATFFAQIKGVRSIPLAAAVTRGLVAFSARAHQTPLFVSLVEATRSALTLQVSDVLGRYVSNANVVVRSISAASDASNVVVTQVDAKPLAASATNTRYTVPFGTVTPACGRYTMRVDAKAAAASDAISVNDATLLFNILCRLEIRDTKLEAITASGTETVSVKYPTKHTSAIALTFKQTLRVTFTIRDKTQSSRAVAVAQAMLRLSHAETGRDAVFVAKLVDATAGTYSAEILFDTRGMETVGRQSGNWQVELLLGDSFVEEPITWHLADLALTFKGAPIPTPFAAHASLPLIEHKFREPSHRPPAIVSMSFAALAIAPLLILIVFLLPRIGVNMRGFPSNFGVVSAFVFHGFLGLILLLYFFFFWAFNMMQTLTYLSVLLVPLFIFGRSLLSRVQERRLHSN